MYLSFFENIQGHNELYLDKILQEMLECVKIGYLVFDNSISSKAKHLTELRHWKTTFIVLSKY